MAIPEAAMACANMLSRLGAGVEASRIQVEKRERKDEERRSAKLTWTTSLVAAVAVPLTLVFSLLGANIKELNPQPSWHDGSLIPAYVLILFILLITVVVGLIIGSRRSNHERSAGVDKLIPPQ
jgi:O-antigen/teichoic acid export membrane protein